MNKSTILSAQVRAYFEAGVYYGQSGTIEEIVKNNPLLESVFSDDLKRIHKKLDRRSRQAEKFVIRIAEYLDIVEDIRCPVNTNHPVK